MSSPSLSPEALGIASLTLSQNVLEALVRRGLLPEDEARRVVERAARENERAAQQGHHAHAQAGELLAQIARVMGEAERGGQDGDDPGAEPAGER